MEEKYLPELMAEKDSLDPSFTHALRLVNQEIEKFQKGEGKDEEKYIDVVINKNMKLGQKVLIPVKQFPKFNFVGKLLGPRGNSLKRLQEETLTKMSILGKGSMRDKAKEEELRKSGEAKYFHLNDDLHVLIEVFAPPAEAYARMGHALEEIKKFLIPDYNDEIRQAQLQELTYLNGGSENADVPVVRGKPTLRTRGVPTPSITRTMMMGTAPLMTNRVMIPMITAIAPLPRVVLITMIMDMDSVKRPMIPTGKRTGLTRDTRHLQRGPQRASTETSPTGDTDCTVWCCEIASLHQSCVLFKEMSAILGSQRNWLCPRSKQRGFPSNYGLLRIRRLTNVPSQ
ncbi:KH domain-containing, RNA-binding, signal transduction-associated protein 3 isoform X2 [Meles meles]|uniref:KH domain-containing, RNA-binding, signal transduction-associated protein 3 isoform X2 n=1 Tax=Meles meles TaxID=9662 RepID=UPI001E69B197|nr:KH domain-containing, RNA-binding, signal transduction-associated protein 3 isoform X2 [Meles meles]